MSVLFDEALSESKNGSSKGEAIDLRMLPTRDKIERVEIPAHPSEASPLQPLFEALGHAPIRAFYDLLPEPKPKKRGSPKPASPKDE